jgi:hypothetical protein
MVAAEGHRLTYSNVERHVLAGQSVIPVLSVERVSWCG